MKKIQKLAISILLDELLPGWFQPLMHTGHLSREIQSNSNLRGCDGVFRCGGINRCPDTGSRPVNGINANYGMTHIFVNEVSNEAVL